MPAGIFCKIFQASFLLTFTCLQAYFDPMKNYTAIFRAHLLQKMRALNVRQVDVVRETGLDQPHVSKIVRRESEMKVSTMCALWPFVYGTEFPMPAEPIIDPPEETDTPPQEERPQ